MLPAVDPFVAFLTVLAVLAISIQAHTYFRWCQAATDEADRRRRQVVAVIWVAFGATSFALFIWFAANYLL